MLRFCKRCGNTKEISEFGSNIRNKDGLSFYCSHCLHEYNVERRAGQVKERKGFYLYKLLDPESKSIRYIGCTCDIDRRYLDHCNVKRQNNQNTRKNNWVKSLQSRNLNPEMVVIELFKTREEAYAAEIKSIAYHRSIGCDLTNLTIGGEGLIGYVKTPEAKENMSKVRRGKKLSLWHRQRISEGSNNRKGKESPNFGKPAHNRLLTIEQAEEIRQLFRDKKMTVIELVDKFGIHRSTIRRILTNVSYKL